MATPETSRQPESDLGRKREHPQTSGQPVSTVHAADLVLPELRPVLDAFTSAARMDFDDIAGLRTQSESDWKVLEEIYVPDAPSVTTTVISAPVSGAEIDVRLHRPEGNGPFPLLVYLHGGGWILGRAYNADRMCRRLAERMHSLVAAVDYRLAPEHPFPTPAEDCYSALVWLAERAAEFECDASALAVGGCSAGALRSWPSGSTFRRWT
jgi:acetyl esterase